MSTAADLAARAHAVRYGPLNDYIVSADALAIARDALNVDDPEVRAAAQAIIDLASEHGAVL